MVKFMLKYHMVINIVKGSNPFAPTIFFELVSFISANLPFLIPFIILHNWLHVGCMKRYYAIENPQDILYLKSLMRKYPYDHSD